MAQRPRLAFLNCGRIHREIASLSQRCAEVANKGTACCASDVRPRALRPMTTHARNVGQVARKRVSDGRYTHVEPCCCCHVVVVVCSTNTTTNKFGNIRRISDRYKNCTYTSLQTWFHSRILQSQTKDRSRFRRARRCTVASRRGSATCYCRRFFGRRTEFK